MMSENVSIENLFVRAVLLAAFEKARREAFADDKTKISSQINDPSKTVNDVMDFIKAKELEKNFFTAREIAAILEMPRPYWPIDRPVDFLYGDEIVHLSKKCEEELAKCKTVGDLQKRADELFNEAAYLNQHNKVDFNFALENAGNADQILNLLKNTGVQLTREKRALVNQQQITSNEILLFLIEKAESSQELVEIINRRKREGFCFSDFFSSIESFRKAADQIVANKHADFSVRQSLASDSFLSKEQIWKLLKQEKSISEINYFAIIKVFLLNPVLKNAKKNLENHLKQPKKEREETEEIKARKKKKEKNLTEFMQIYDLLSNENARLDKVFLVEKPKDEASESVDLTSKNSVDSTVHEKHTLTSPIVVENPEFRSVKKELIAEIESYIKKARSMSLTLVFGSISKTVKKIQHAQHLIEEINDAKHLSEIQEKIRTAISFNNDLEKNTAKKNRFDQCLISCSEKISKFKGNQSGVVSSDGSRTDHASAFNPSEATEKHGD